MNDRLKSLYQTVILAKAKDERFVGQLVGYTHKIAAYNPLCGDKYVLQMIVEGDVIKSLKYSGSGCSISKASTAVLCETLEGTSIHQLENQIIRFLEIIDENSTRMPGEITADDRLLAFASAREFPERKTCADLAWMALKVHLTKG